MIKWPCIADLKTGKGLRKQELPPYWVEKEALPAVKPDPEAVTVIWPGVSTTRIKPAAIPPSARMEAGETSSAGPDTEKVTVLFDSVTAGVPLTSRN